MYLAHRKKQPLILTALFHCSHDPQRISGVKKPRNGKNCVDRVNEIPCRLDRFVSERLHYSGQVMRQNKTVGCSDMLGLCRLGSLYNFSWCCTGHLSQLTDRFLSFRLRKIKKRKVSQWSIHLLLLSVQIDRIRILRIELQLACNEGSCGEISLIIFSFKQIPRMNLHPLQSSSSSVLLI